MVAAVAEHITITPGGIAHQVLLDHTYQKAAAMVVIGITIITADLPESDPEVI